jgi:hypothetical protein
MFLSISSLSCQQANPAVELALAADECSNLINHSPTPTRFEQLLNTIAKYAICKTNQQLADLADKQFFISSDCATPSKLDDINLCGAVAGSGEKCITTTDPETAVETKACAYEYTYAVTELKGLGSMKLDYNRVSVAPFSTSEDGSILVSTMTVPTAPVSSSSAYARLSAKAAGIPIGDFDDWASLGKNVTATLEVQLVMDCGNLNNSALEISINKLTLNGLSVSLPSKWNDQILRLFEGKITDGAKSAIEEKLPRILNNLISPQKDQPLRIPNPLFCPTWGCEKVDSIALTGQCIPLVDSADGKNYFERKAGCLTGGSCTAAQGFTCAGVTYKGVQCVPSDVGKTSPGATSYKKCKDKCPCNGYGGVANFGPDCREQCLLAGTTCDTPPYTCCGNTQCVSTGPPLCRGPPLCTGPDPDECCFERARVCQ